MANVHRSHAIRSVGLSLLIAGLVLHAPGASRPAAQTAVAFTVLAEIYEPYGGVILGSDGALYGTSRSGPGIEAACGFVYRLEPQGDGTYQRTILHEFPAGGSKGCYPQGELVEGPDGAFYGTTLIGGPHAGQQGLGTGTIFRVTTAGDYQLLHAFASYSASGYYEDGIHPNAGLTLGPDGNLYGSTGWGGIQGPSDSYPNGTIFRISPAGSFQVIHHLQSGDGKNISDALTLGSDGAFYGTAFDASVYPQSITGGNLFRVTPDGNFTRLFRFPHNQTFQTDCCPLGADPMAAPTEVNGDFYLAGRSWGPAGFGTVVRVDAAGTGALVYAFTGGVDGGTPQEALTLGTDGYLYGLTSGVNQTGPTIFRVGPDGAHETLHEFVLSGAGPQGRLLEIAPGEFIGTTASGLFSGGYVYKFTVDADNRAPTASGGALSTDEDTSVSGQLTASDPDGDALTYSIVANGSIGTAILTDASTGAFTYTPHPDANGADAFTFRVNDGSVESNVATMTVDVTPVNDAPVAHDSLSTATEDVPMPGTFQASDVDGPSLTFAIVVNGSKGMATLTNAATGAFTYVPNPNVHGTDTVQFQVSDGALSSNVGTFTIEIAPAYDAPLAQTSVTTTTSGVAATGTLQARNVDGAALTFSLVTPPAQGLVSITDAATGAFTYTPNTGASGYDPFTFAVSDGGVPSQATQMVFIVAAMPQWPGYTTRVSVANDGTEGDNVSCEQSSLSADGRYVAFQSAAGNLVPDDWNSYDDVFVRDRQTGTTRRVSVASDRTQALNRSRAPSLSADGRYVAFQSFANTLVPGDTNGVADVFVHDLQSGETRRVSVASDGTPANDLSARPSLSADGRYVAFSSLATNLVLGDTNGTYDVFVHDLDTGTTQRVSVASDGAAGNFSSDGPSLSADGRYVAFYSFATNLVPGDLNGAGDVFVHDLHTGVTRRVSVASDGTPANGGSQWTSISADGRYVGFWSFASNLESGDTTASWDVFVHDQETGETRRVGTPASNGTPPAPPSLSADGRYVAFSSLAATLVSGDTNDARDVFVLDRLGGNLRRVSVASDGTEGNSDSSRPSLSADGRHIAFCSYASTLVQGDTNGTGDIFVADAATAPTIPVASNGLLTTQEDTSAPGMLIAADSQGAALTFAIVANGGLGTAVVTDAASGAFTYTPNLDAHGSDTFTFQASNGTATSNVATVTVTITPVNDAPVASDGALALTADTSAGGTLTATDIDSPTLTFTLVANGGQGTAVITDPATGAYTYTANAGTSGTDTFTFTANDGALDSNVATVTVTIAPAPPTVRTGVVTTPAATPVSNTLSATSSSGSPLTFTLVSTGEKGAATLVDAATGAFSYTPNVGEYGYDTFTFTARDAHGTSAPAVQMVFIVAATPHWPGQTVRASVTSVGAQVAAQSARNAISADGRYIAFDSSASSYVAGDTNNRYDVFVRDRLTGQIERVSVATDGSEGNSDSVSPGISADGRFVVFASVASNLVADDSNGAPDVFVRDRLLGETTRVSVASGGIQAHATASNGPFAISADGRIVAFPSNAPDLVPNDTNGTFDVFVHDRETRMTSRVSESAAGVEGNGISLWPALSADGRYVAFYSAASTIVPADTNQRPDVFVRDRLTGVVDRVSVGPAGVEADQQSALPAISADGRFIAFWSHASNLVAGDTNGFSDVFVHDRATSLTSRVSVRGDGAQGDGQSGPGGVAGDVRLSADGRYVAFVSQASNLVADDTNGLTDIFVHDRVTSQLRRVSVGSDGSQGDSQPAQPMLSADGRFISFDSAATTLVPGDTNAQWDVFIVGGVTVSPSAQPFESGGGNGDVTVRFAYPGTTWGATSHTPWITVTGQDHVEADGVVTYSVAPNLGPERTGTLSVALQSVTITQAGTSVPTATDGATTTEEDVPVVGMLTATDPHGATLTYAVVSNGGLGTALVTDAAIGAYTYTPNPNAHGTDTFTFQASNGTATSNVATVTVTITPVNDAPVASDGTLALTAGTSAGGTLTAADIDSPALTFTLVDNGGQGTAVITNPATGAYTYTANAGASGTDAFMFRANDGTLDSNLATVTVAIAPANQPPVASGASLTTAEDKSASGTLVAVDPERDRLMFSIVTGASRGTVTITNDRTGRFTYVPHANANGADSFTFKASDGVQDSNVATVAVMVTPVNDPPIAIDGTLTTLRNTTSSGTLQGADVDGDALTFSVARAPRRGTLTLTDPATGAFTYTPNANFSGSDTFTFRVSDGSATAAGTVSITVTP